MQNRHSVKFLKRRKFMLVLPLLTLPFVTMVFWIMGGGSANATSQKTTATGLNLDLPDAKLLEEKNKNKLSFYDQAQQDSNRIRQEMLNDPYFKNRLDTVTIPMNISNEQTSFSGSGNLNPFPHSSTVAGNSTESKIYEKLTVLNKALQNNSTKSELKQNISTPSQGDLSEDMSKLESMMQLMNEKGGDDPEMKELNGMLDKILDIQHPERVKSREKESPVEEKTKVLSVGQPNKNRNASYFGNNGKNASENKSSFYGEAFNESFSAASNTIEAVIHQTQTITTGSTVKLRLLADIEINGRVVTKGSFIYGIASVDKERLLIHVPGIRQASDIVPVSLEVYDMDGLAGIYIPGSMSRDVMKSSAEQSIQSIDLMNFDPSLKAQAAAAGIQTAKSLLSRKAKLVKVTLKAGYKILLKEEKK